MCWIASKYYPDTLIEKSADEDIVVYKVMRRKENSRLLSYFKGFEYVPEELYSIQKDLVIYDEGDDKRTISEGLHSYSGKCVVEIWLRDEMINIHGIDWMHRDTNLNMPYHKYDGNGDNDIVIVKCVIPVGSKYYRNEDGEIVSDWLSPTKDYISCNKLMDYVMRGHSDVMTFDQIFECSNVNRYYK